MGTKLSKNAERSAETDRSALFFMKFLHVALVRQL